MYIYIYIYIQASVLKAGEWPGVTIITIELLTGQFLFSAVHQK